MNPAHPRVARVTCTAYPDLFEDDLLSPAFDGTCSFNPAGLWTATRQMSINGKRDAFELEDFSACARTVGMKRGRAESILAEVERVVRRWPDYAEAAGVEPRQREQIRAAHRRGVQGHRHETITRAWVMAVAHFKRQSEPCASADAFMAGSPQLLDSKIMLTHYSAAVLFSPAARESFVAPDIQEIPSD